MVICWSLVKPLMAKIMTFHCYPLGIAETLRGDEPPLACAARHILLQGLETDEDLQTGGHRNESK